MLLENQNRASHWGYGQNPNDCRIQMTVGHYLPKGRPGGHTRGAGNPMGQPAHTGGRWPCPLDSRRLAVASPPPLRFSLYKYLRCPGELLTPLTLSHFHSQTHSLAPKFPSSIFQQVLMQENCKNSKLKLVFGFSFYILC